MEHLVTFQSAEGREGHHTAKSLDDALRFVERLRNNEEASDVRVYRMQEVPIEFRAYFKVEVKSGDAVERHDDGPVPEETAAEAPAATVTAKPLIGAANAGVDAEATDQANRRLFSRS